MKGYPLGSDDTVSKVAELNFKGNVVPLEWFNHIKRNNGKPNLTAIWLLSDIVYWYRPVEVQDETTGKRGGYRKKFKADLLQRSYDEFVKKYGFSKNQVRSAMDALEEAGIIYRVFRHPVVNGKKLGNVLYIGLNVDRLKEITTPLSDSITTPSANKIAHPLPIESDTNTEITTETPTETSIYTAASGGDGVPLLTVEDNTANAEELESGEFRENISADKFLPETQVQRDILDACRQKYFTNQARLSIRRIEEGSRPLSSGLESEYPLEWIYECIDWAIQKNETRKIINFSKLLKAIENKDRKARFLNGQKANSRPGGSSKPILDNSKYDVPSRLPDL